MKEMKESSKGPTMQLYFVFSLLVCWTFQPWRCLISKRRGGLVTSAARGRKKRDMGCVCVKWQCGLRAYQGLCRLLIWADTWGTGAVCECVFEVSGSSGLTQRNVTSMFGSCFSRFSTSAGVRIFLRYSNHKETQNKSTLNGFNTCNIIKNVYLYYPTHRKQFTLGKL